MSESMCMVCNSSSRLSLVTTAPTPLKREKEERNIYRVRVRVRVVVSRHNRPHTLMIGEEGEKHI